MGLRRTPSRSGLESQPHTIKFKGEEIAQGDVLVDYYLAIASSNSDVDIDGIETIEPAFGLEAKWISGTNKIKAEMAGYTLIDPTSVIVTHLSEVVKKHADELLTRQELNQMINNLKKTNEILVNDLIPNVVSIITLQKVCANLLKEQVSIRDLENIIETLGDFAPNIRDIDVLTEYVRQSLKRSITSKFSENKSMKVLTLDAPIEKMIMDNLKKIDQGSYLSLDNGSIHQIITATNVETDRIKDLVPSIIILTSPIVRTYFKRLIDQFIDGVVVLSYNEIDTNIQIQSLGTIQL